MPLKLKLMTYLVPDLPLDLFQTLQYYLEENLKIPTSLCVESRCDGPVTKSNPILDGDADLMFISSTSFLRLSEENSKEIELLPVAPIFIHSSSDQRPIYYSQILVSTDRKGLYKDLVSLKGSRFAYDKKGSIASEIPMLAALKAQGHNATFFGHTSATGSQYASIKMLLQGRADVTTVDSVALELYFRNHPENREKLTILDSLGPLPIFPMVVNSRLPTEMKAKLTELFLTMSTQDTWKQKLMKYNISGFQTISESLYNLEKTMRTQCEKVTMNPAYY